MQAATSESPQAVLQAASSKHSVIQAVGSKDSMPCARLLVQGTTYNLQNYNGCNCYTLLEPYTTIQP